MATEPIAKRLPPETRDKPVPVGESNIRPPIRGGRATLPRCPGCGVSTLATERYPRGEPCEVCIDKPQFQAPKATQDLTKQPETAYADGGPAVPRV